MERRPYRKKRQECRFSEWSRQARPLPWFRADGGWLFAAQSRHEKPYPPMSKIKPTFPLHPSSHGECEKVYPIPPPLSSGKCSFWELYEGCRS